MAVGVLTERTKKRSVKPRVNFNLAEDSVHEAKREEGLLQVGTGNPFNDSLASTPTEHNLLVSTQSSVSLPWIRAEYTTSEILR